MRLCSAFQPVLRTQARSKKKWHKPVIDATYKQTFSIGENINDYRLK
jgi:hypothetical protein